MDLNRARNRLPYIGELGASVILCHFGTNHVLATPDMAASELRWLTGQVELIEPHLRSHEPYVSIRDRL